MELAPVAISWRKEVKIEYMTFQENIPLAEYTTFKIGGPARFFCLVANEDELLKAITFAQEKKLAIFVLGGGSNIVMSDKGFDGLVIKMEIGGIEKLKIERIERFKETKDESVDFVVVSAGAGVMWDSLVEYAVEHNLYGIENLSAIPGTVGAAPVQNIGAYGAEAAQTIVKVRAFDMQSMKFVELGNKECQFTYRHSIFKELKGRYIITRVDFKLVPNGAVNIEYRDLKEYFQKNTMPSSLTAVRAAVIDIRWNKLPDWKLWGTAGSFFKNPIIRAEHYESLKKKYPDLPGFPESSGDVKVSLGWILDKVCNMKGLCIGNVCTYEKQALVLVSKPGATSEEVIAVAQSIMKTVKEKTDIDIEGEVEWVN